MPTVPVRGLGEIGVMADLSPQDAPFTAFSEARNIRFAEGKLSRSSVFKTFDSAYTYAKTPVGILDGGAATDEGYVVTVFSDGTMEQRYNGGTATVTPVATLSSANDQITTCKLGGVTYVNRQTDLPIYRKSPSNGVFVVLPGWDASWRCKSLRSYKDFLISLNVSQGATNYPAMVKWSDATQAGVPPANWDIANPASLAGETVLNDLTGEIIDGGPLQDSFIIYGQTQTFRMDFIGAPLVFRFSKIFEDQGAIAKNCSVDVDGRHYVFGRSDLYMHDGLQRVSIANGKVLNHVFKELDFDKRDRCFIYHDRFNSEIAFCYPTTDDAPWGTDSIQGVNRAVVFNYRYNTWTFLDLPALIGWMEVSESSTITWADLASSWAETTGPWSSFGTQLPRTLLVCSAGLSGIKAGQPYIVDNISGRVSNLTDLDVTWDAYARALYKDVDEMGANLIGRKLVSRIVPQVLTEDPQAFVKMRFGQSPNLVNEATWGAWKNFNPWSDYKYDTRINGRYLHFEFLIPSGTYAELGGFDADLKQISGR